MTPEQKWFRALPEGSCARCYHWQGHRPRQFGKIDVQGECICPVPKAWHGGWKMAASSNWDKPCPAFEQIIDVCWQPEVPP